MSEKQFRLSKYVTPTSISYFYNQQGQMLNKEVASMLNKLYDENVQLKEKNEQLKEENKKLIEEWEFSFRTEMAHHRFAEKELQEKIREKQATIKSKDKQLERLYNYFQHYLKDEMGGNAFSEMWDFVKEDERWNDE